MILNIDFQSDTPIYEQFKRQVIQGIASGKLQKGESLPPVRQMAEDIGINLNTVNKAYNILKNEGYLNIDRRIGAVVSSIMPEADSNYSENLNNELEFIIADAVCRGVTRDNFFEICSNIFKKFERNDI